MIDDPKFRAIFDALQKDFGVDTDLKVFMVACKRHGISDAKDEYRIFTEALKLGQAFLPSCIQYEHSRCHAPV